MQISNRLYIFFLCCVTLFSYSFVDGNFPLNAGFITYLRSTSPVLKTVLYSLHIIIYYGFYLFFLKNARKWTSRTVWKIIFLTCFILFFSFPAFSNDVFNYIATAKVTYFYRENPYIVMPLEFTHEPMLAFMHAANKVALYGPAWILLTFIPFSLGFNNLFSTIFLFKLFILLFYLGLCFLIWIVSKKNIHTLVLFALNPLVILETLVSSHNDVVMMFFGLLAFYLLINKKYITSVASLVISILIKYATLILLPFYLFFLYKQLTSKKINMNTMWLWCSYGLYVVLFLSPLREEIYSWYFIWPLTFIVLTKNNSFLKSVTVAFSFGLLFRFAPFIYMRQWYGITPVVKKIVSFVPPAVAFFMYPYYKKLLR